MKLTLYIVLLAVILIGCSQVPESSLDLPAEPPSPGSQDLYGRAISDVGTVPTWAAPIKYTTINKDLLQTGEKLVITTQKPAFYQGSSAQFVVYDKAYFYNDQSKTWTQVTATSALSGAQAATNAPWKLDKGVFELTMDSRFSDGKNFFLVYYCGRATANGTWDCESSKWKIGAFEYRPLRVNCGDGFIDPDEQCERDSDCSSGKLCSSCMCMTPEEQRAGVLETQMKANGKKTDILLPVKIELGAKDDVYIGVNNTAINPTGDEVCFRTQIKCLSAPSGSYCKPSAQQNNIIVGGHDMSTGNAVSNGWFYDVSDVDLPNNELSVFLGEIEPPKNLAQGIYQMRMQVYKNKDNKACGSTFGTAVETEYALIDFNINLTASNITTPSLNQSNTTNQTASFCGDGNVTGTEQCDPPGNITNGVCTSNCTITCNSGYSKSGNQCVQVQQNKEWNKVGTCTTSGWGGSTPQCPQMSCPSFPQGKVCTHPIGTQCEWALTEVYECQLKSTTLYTWMSMGTCTMTGQQGQTPCPTGTTLCATGTQSGNFCQSSQFGSYCASLTGSGAIITPYFQCVAQATTPGPSVPQDLRWIVEGICSDPSCHGSMCAAPCPSGKIDDTDLGTTCPTKSQAKKVDSKWQMGNPDTFVLAKCGDVMGVTAYSWQEHVECGGITNIPCPQSGHGPPIGSSCSLNQMKDLYYNTKQGKDYIIACKPTIMSQVQFAQPQFPVTQVPGITGAVSFDDVVNSRSTQIAIVLIATLGIFIITLLNVVHKEK